jgi:hypothetical protein
MSEDPQSHPRTRIMRCSSRSVPVRKGSGQSHHHRVATMLQYRLAVRWLRPHRPLFKFIPTRHQNEQWLIDLPEARPPRCILPLHLHSHSQASAVPKKRDLVLGLPLPCAPQFCLSGHPCQATILPSRSLHLLRIAHPLKISIRTQADHDHCLAAASTARHLRRIRFRHCLTTHRCLARQCLASRQGTKYPRSSVMPSCVKRYE